MSEPMPDALIRLGESLAEAACEALRTATDAVVSVGELTVLSDYESVVAHVAPGRVVIDASSIDGAAGRGLLLLTPATARTLLVGPAGADDELATVDAEPLSDAELAAMADLGDRVNAAIGDTLRGLFGARVHYDKAHASTVEDARLVVRHGAVQAICATLEIGEQPCWLIQFAPNALVMRAARAFEELVEAASHQVIGGDGAGPSARTLGGVNLRVWAELGRTELALADALALPLGAVVELDRAAEDPIDLLVNGVSFGTGRLIVTDDGEWAFVLDEVSHRPD